MYSLCNLYSLTKSQAAIIAITRALRDATGNLPPLPGIYPDYKAPIVRNAAGSPVRQLQDRLRAEFENETKATRKA